MSIFIRTVPNVMQHFKCSAETAQRYIDLRDEGHGTMQAAVMAGLMDPPDPDMEDELLHASDGLRQRIAELEDKRRRALDAAGNLEYESWQPSSAHISGESPASTPVATIHVDGSFIHVEWHGATPNQCHMPVYAAPASGVREDRAADLDKLLAQILNRRVTIEQRMFDAASGKRPMPTADELRQWAVELGTPTPGVASPAETSDQLVTGEKK